jgi:hypothetical protein
VIRELRGRQGDVVAGAADVAEAIGEVAELYGLAFRKIGEGADDGIGPVVVDQGEASVRQRVIVDGIEEEIAGKRDRPVKP